ncbi:MAG TPA: MOSC domain-containing protein [Nocardioidaceae bacterium]
MTVVPVVVGVQASSAHSFSKAQRPVIRLVVGVGVEGDAHAGRTVQHRSRVRRDPTQPNLRQVHLVHAELQDELEQQGFRVTPGDIGENITTRGLDILGLPRGSRLRLGSEAVVEITGLRNPCRQLDDFQPGLMQASLARNAAGGLVRKAGVMGIVVAGGDVRAGDVIGVELPVPPHQALQPV